MRRLVINNPILDPTYQTFVSTAYASGVSLTVTSTVSFAASDLLVIGQPAEEKTELKKLDSVASITVLTLASALNFAHPENTPVYRSLWDIVEIEANTGAGFAVVTQSAIQWDNRDNKTVYNHSAGTNNTSYRFRFYNSVTTTYSEYSPTLTGGLAAADTVGYMINSVRRILNDPDGRIVEDAEIIRDFNEAQNIIYAKRRDWWFLKFEDSTINIVANQGTYNLDLLGSGSALSPGISLGYLDTVRFNLNSSAQDIVYHLKFKSTLEFDTLVRDNNRTGSDNVVWYTIDPPDSNSENGYLRIEPIPTSAAGKLYIRGWKQFPLLDDVADTTVVPVPSLLENYAISKGFRVKGNDTKADDYENRFFGPPPGKQRFDKLEGIPMLEGLNHAQKRPRGAPQSLARFRGRRSYYGDNVVNRDDYVERHLTDG